MSTSKLSLKYQFLMLFIFGGLPGTGKSTLSSLLARHFGAFYLRIDTIEQSLRDSGLTLSGPEGYVIGYALALENLQLGTSVVADSVNPLSITRAAWRGVAYKAQVSFVEIEVICSDLEEHRARVESRPSNVPNLKLPSWQDVVTRHYEVWPEPHIVIDTAGDSPEQSLMRLHQRLADKQKGTATSPLCL